jgi:3-oxoacyl-[acyl-carrier protein] reductase
VLLEGKTALVYGGGGSIGRAMATAFAREGARVHLAGRTAGPLEAAAEEIRRAGGAVETAQLDALDAGAVDAHVDGVAERSGGVDISATAISLGEAFGTPLVETSPADFERPVVTALRSTLLTARAAARHMVERRSGVILTFGGYGRPPTDFYLGGFQVALSAVDALRRQLAAELGSHGIRVLTLQSTGVSEAFGDDPDALLGRRATLADVGNAAAFAASDQAGAMTATALNITCGAEVD